MKKINLKSLSIDLVIGILLTSGAVYASSLINSHDVTFSPNDETWDVDNVETALDDLFDSINNANPGSEYLRWDENTKYVQVLTSGDTWKNLYYAESLPLAETYIYKDGTKPYGTLSFSNYGSGESRGSSISDNGSVITMTHASGLGYVGGTISRQLPFEIKAGSKVHVMFSEVLFHPSVASMTVTNASSVTIPGVSDYSTTVFYNKEVVATINTDIASGSNLSISFNYIYDHAKISKIWITEN